ncbi:MAG: hypothetical protein IPN36_19275 [Bacteroidetes bacterium]|nr:hypothetical protein [Bacteroidota bacterium]
MNLSNTSPFAHAVLVIVFGHFALQSFGQSFTLHPDSLKRTIRISYPLAGVKPDSLEREEIRKKNNELFSAVHIDLISLSGEHLSAREATCLTERMKEVEGILLEEGVPKKRISRKWINSPQERQLLKLTSSLLLIQYELPPDYFTLNYRRRNVNPLCLKDTIIQSANGILLKYDLCTYLAKQNLPVIHVFDLSSSTNDTNEPNLLMENRKGYRLVTLFEYRNNNEELLPDKILIPLTSNEKNATFLMEYFNDSLRMWLQIKSDVSRFIKVNGKEYYPVSLQHDGFFRLSALSPSQMHLLYVSAPPQLSFYRAVLVMGVYQSWPAEIINGGTAALFILPVEYTGLHGQFSMLTLEKQIRYATEAPIGQQLGKRYRIPESMQGNVMVDGRNYKIPEYGFRLNDDFDAVKSVAIDHIK